MRRRHQVDLNPQIAGYEIGWVGLILEYTPHLSSGHDDDLRLNSLEKRKNLALIREIKVGAAAHDDIPIAIRLQSAHESGSDETTVTGDINSCCSVHGSTRRSEPCRLIKHNPASAGFELKRDMDQARQVLTHVFLLFRPHEEQEKTAAPGAK